MKATSWIFRSLTQNEFKAITNQIQSQGGGSQTYIDLPKGSISDANLNIFLDPVLQPMLMMDINGKYLFTAFHYLLPHKQ